MFYVVIPLKDYPYDTVYMSLEFSRVVELSKPIVIKIKYNAKGEVPAN